MGNRRQQKRAETRRQILDAAYALFTGTGYQRTTMRALSQWAGVARGTILAHFPDKPSLLVATCLQDLGETLWDALASMPEHPIMDQLAHLTSRTYSFYAQDLPYSRTLLKESLFLGGEHGAALDQQLQELLRTVAVLVARAAARGELPPGIDPELTANAFGSFYLGALVIGLKGSSFDVEAQVGQVRSMLGAWFSVA
jgi:AcrR family transcriptional regulator